MSGGTQISGGTYPSSGGTFVPPLKQLRLKFNVIDVGCK